MKPPENAIQIQSREPPSSAPARRQRRIDEQGGQARPGQIAAVAGTDEDAVEDEHDPGEGLPDCGDDEHRREQVGVRRGPR